MNEGSLMKTKLLCLVVLIYAGTLMAGVNFSYTLAQPMVQETPSGITLSLDGAQLMGEPGDPALPRFGVKLLLPEGNEAISISVKRYQPVSYQLKAKIAALQPQYPLSWDKEIIPIQANPDIYTSEEAYPKANYETLSTHYLSGHPIAFSAVSPFEYYPLRDELVFYQNISVEIEYAPSARALAAQRLLKKDAFVQKRLMQSVDNAAPQYAATREAGFEYLMIVDAEKIANWQPLVDYYQGIGMSVEIKTVADILAASTGADTQEKIRNFIISYYEANPLRYVLLGGDTDVIPHRGFYVNMGNGGESDSDIPADMYYSCLDGTWNDDNDSNWGEVYETDLTPELAVGRICYNSDLEIANQIYKIVTYQMIPVVESIESALFVGEWLWDGPTWGGDYMDEMIGGSSNHGYTTVGVPSDWDISTMYDRTYGAEESWGPSDIRPLLSNGPNLVNHLGHSNTTYNMRLSNSQVSSSSIVNAGDFENFSIYFTQGCYAGSFDNRNTYPGSYTEDSITEKLTSISTAAAAMISHSRYGWGMQGSTDGASQYLHREYIDAIFGENINEVGYTLVDSKIDNIPFITNQAVMYWVDYETNLFGCPAMMIWSDTPQNISVNLPSQWLVGLNQYTIQSDVPGARLVLKQDQNIFYEGIANDAGIFNVHLLESLNPGTYQVYITAPNYYPYQASVYVTASEMPYIICNDISFADNDAVYHTGEEVGISLWVKNVGMVDQQNTGTLSLSSASENIQIIDGILDFSALSAADSIYIEDAFQILITGCFADHAQASLTFTASYDDYETESFARLTLAAPVLSVPTYNVSFPNSFVMPGDQVQISFSLLNNGSGTAFSPMMLLFSNNPAATTSVYDLSLPPVVPGNEMNVPNAFSVQIAEDASDSELINIGYMLTAENGNVVEGVFSIHVGMLNYSFEPDAQNWTSTQLDNNFVDQWHRSNSQNHTDDGLYAMKFGGTGSAQYASSSYGALMSPEVSITANSKFRFYHKMDAEDHDDNPSQAWDGGMVQMSLNGGTWQQISPVGGYPHTIYSNPASPFASGTPVFSGQFDWTEAVFELGEVSGTARFRFVFGSDAYVSGDGWYIDDVLIESLPSDSQDEYLVHKPVTLLPNYPNPFNPNTSISFSLPEADMVSLEIFNIKGQRVRVLARGEMPAGSSTMNWNGKDDSGVSVASGVYFYRLKTSKSVLNRKMMLMK